MSQDAFYTKDYEGEMISIALSWRDKNNPDKMTWVDKTIINDDHDGIAHVLGNGKSRLKLNLNFLHGQTGGSSVRGVGQSYGCNLLYKDFNPTFLISTNVNICKDIVDSGYTEDNIVYTNVKNILKNPDHFHLYPNIYTAHAGALALRLACAEGHKTIYLVGMEGYEHPTDNIYVDTHPNYIEQTSYERTNEKFVEMNIRIMQAYPDVAFYFVVDQLGTISQQYKWCGNVKELRFNEYISHASLGAMHHG